MIDYKLMEKILGKEEEMQRKTYISEINAKVELPKDEEVKIYSPPSSAFYNTYNPRTGVITSHYKKPWERTQY